MSFKEIFDVLQRFDEEYIPFPPFVAAVDAVKANLTLFREAGIAQHLLVLGESGAGKSSLCSWVEQQHPKLTLPDRDVLPVLIVSVPSAATIASMASALLEKLGDPASATGTASAKTSRVITLCRACRVEMILFDEAQHIHDRGQATTHYMVGDWLKSLIDQTGVPTVFLGLPRLEQLLQVNEQLRRRFSRRIRLALAFLLLDTLRELEMDRGPSFVAVGDVYKRVIERVLTVTAEDLDFVIDSLASEREIRYGVENSNGGFDFGLTKDSTPLIEKARGFAQIQLSENGRLLLRVSAMKESWLYSDLDAERLVKAIERGQFGDIPRFCQMMILEIATKNKQLSSALERPTLAELRDMLVEDGTGIAESLRGANEVVKRACVLIFEDRTREAFTHWKARNGVSYSIGNLQTEIELVLQHVESLSRRFVRFLETAQRARASGGEGIPFLSVIESMTTPSSVPDVKRLEAMLGGLMPWGIRSAFFHPTQLVGSVDFSTLEESGEGRVTSSFTLDASRGSGHSRLLDFILRNRAFLIDKLSSQPMSFSEMIAETGFLLEAGESPVDFFGIYTAPEHLDGEGFRLCVGNTGNVFNARIAGIRFSGSDPLMFLMEDD